MLNIEKKWSRILLAATAMATAASAALIGMTFEDFHLSGTQVGQIPAAVFHDSNDCANCHGYFDPQHEPYSNWKGSLMAMAGRDPLFLAQMTNANQDVANVGYYCMRCHVPMTFVTGNAYVPDGSTLNPLDRDGVTCHFCHSMVDPIYKPGVSPPEDLAVLATLPSTPQFYANSQFVLDPSGLRRGPFADPQAPHAAIYSAFHTKGDLCGTCHDVGNVAIARQPDGTWSYNGLNQRVPNEDPHTQFPLERTYTEWKLSAFANGGVDMGGRFGGDLTHIESCQDCHMPMSAGKACYFGPDRPNLRVHEFAGAAVQVLDMIALQFSNDGEVDQLAIRNSRAKSMSMLARAATVRTEQVRDSLRVRTTNETGHKLPTGHIEGRRVWIGVRFFDSTGAPLREYGHYDAEQAELDEPSTRIYEMEVGLSSAASSLTGLPSGVTAHMSLADTIVKDNRIPPRGFANATFEAAGAPVVGHVYADGQYWDDAWFAIPRGAARAEVTVNYQSLPRHYIDGLQSGNVTDARGQILHDLWEQTGKGAPIKMATASATIAPFLIGDVDGNCTVDTEDIFAMRAAFGRSWSDPAFDPHADIDGDHVITTRDYVILLRLLGRHC